MRADVLFKITEGPQVIVDHIIIVGNRRISTRTIERELLLHEGEPLGYSALVESRTRLFALGMFRRAQIEPLGHGGEARRDVLVEVEESPPTELGFGGGLEGGSFVALATTALQRNASRLHRAASFKSAGATSGERIGGSISLRALPSGLVIHRQWRFRRLRHRTVRQ